MMQQQQMEQQKLQQQQQQLEQQQRMQQQLEQQRLQEQQKAMAEAQRGAQKQQQSPAHKGAVYQAMYDYDAQDDDEVGFQENDLVVNVEPIDEGWMFGTIQRTGQRGMLPANYVERVQ